MLAKVLCIAEYYLPGYLGGGPIRTLENIRVLLREDLTMAIFTRDRDLGQRTPYSNIVQDRWISKTDGPIYYARPATFNAGQVLAFCKGRDFDVLYLNSFFSYSASISIVLRLRFLRRSQPSILIAPRGEFSSGALAIKSVKKRAFLRIVRFLRLYKGVHWHASTIFEKNDILREFPEAKGRVFLAADPVAQGDRYEASTSAPPKKAGMLRISFISRISPKKNLDGLLSILRGVKSDVALAIYGPVEENAYWEKCLKRISELPPNVEVDYRGALAPEGVANAFASSDLFAFPTHGENFGHVIFESLRVGTPVLISDQTPWQNSGCGSVSVLPLEAEGAWQRHIEMAADRTAKQQAALRLRSIEFAKNNMKMDETKKDNLDMFRAVAVREDLN